MCGALYSDLATPLSVFSSTPLCAQGCRRGRSAIPGGCQLAGRSPRFLRWADPSRMFTCIRSFWSAIPATDSQSEPQHTSDSSRSSYRSTVCSLKRDYKRLQIDLCTPVVRLTLGCIGLARAFRDSAWLLGPGTPAFVLVGSTHWNSGFRRTSYKHLVGSSGITFRRRERLKRGMVGLVPIPLSSSIGSDPSFALVSARRFLGWCYAPLSFHPRI